MTAEQNHSHMSIEIENDKTAPECVMIEEEDWGKFKMPVA